MCAQYMLVAELRELERLGLRAPDQIGEFTDRIVPYRFGPVAVLEGGDLVVKPMSFSLVPSWSKEPRVKFATHNARLDGIDVKPTWKKPFQTRRCLVPMTDFFEPIYDGEHAGFMVGFRRTDRGVIVAAGVWDQWVNKQTGEIIESFAIITNDPVPFVRDAGHDRTPVFLKPEDWRIWLNDASVDQLKSLLLNQPHAVDLEVYRDRAMRPGWEKRK